MNTNVNMMKVKMIKSQKGRVFPTGRFVTKHEISSQLLPRVALGFLDKAQITGINLPSKKDLEKIEVSTIMTRKCPNILTFEGEDKDGTKKHTVEYIVDNYGVVNVQKHTDVNYDKADQVNMAAEVANFCKYDKDLVAIKGKGRTIEIIPNARKENKFGVYADCFAILPKIKLLCSKGYKIPAEVNTLAPHEKINFTNASIDSAHCATDLTKVLKNSQVKVGDWFSIDNKSAKLIADRLDHMPFVSKFIPTSMIDENMDPETGCGLPPTNLTPLLYGKKKSYILNSTVYIITDVKEAKPGMVEITALPSSAYIIKGTIGRIEKIKENISDIGKILSDKTEYSFYATRQKDDWLPSFINIKGCSLPIVLDNERTWLYWSNNRRYGGGNHYCESLMYKLINTVCKFYRGCWCDTENFDKIIRTCARFGKRLRSKESMHTWFSLRQTFFETAEVRPIIYFENVKHSKVPKGEVNNRLFKEDIFEFGGKKFYVFAPGKAFCLDTLGTTREISEEQTKMLSLVFRQYLLKTIKNLSGFDERKLKTGNFNCRERVESVDSITYYKFFNSLMQIENGEIVFPYVRFGAFDENTRLILWNLVTAAGEDTMKSLTKTDFAKRANTYPYEVLCKWYTKALYGKNEEEEI